MQLRSLLLLVAAVATVGLTRGADSARKELVTQVESCQAILQEFQASSKTAIPANVLHQAKALVIVNEFQAGFIFGAKGGYGVVLVRQPDGRWSVPVFLDAGEASFGFQLGAKSVRTIFVVMDDAGARLLYKARFNFGVDAVAVAGPLMAKSQESTPILKSLVYTYQMNTGLYAGAKFKTGWLAGDNSKTRSFYNTERTIPEVLFSTWVTPAPEAEPLMNYVRRLASE
jgi:lipid-binding SYLF domain-containing protein